MATFVKYNSFVEHLAEKVHNLGSDTLKIMLSNSAPNVATHTVRSEASEISAGNGYTAGGNAVTVTGSSQTGGSYTLTQSADVVFTASGAVGPFRYAILYNDTPTSPADPLIAYWDYASSISLANGETFTVDMGATILTIA
jgi:hypothetical protein